MSVKTLYGSMVICAVVLCTSAAAIDASPNGRWKRDGSGACVFDPADSGPDQCTPGRWKLDGSGNCYFEPHDSGPDQCTISPYQTVRRGN